MALQDLLSLYRAHLNELLIVSSLKRLIEIWYLQVFVQWVWFSPVAIMPISHGWTAPRWRTGDFFLAIVFHPFTNQLTFISWLWTAWSCKFYPTCHYYPETGRSSLDPYHFPYLVWHFFSQALYCSFSSSSGSAHLYYLTNKNLRIKSTTESFSFAHLAL